MSLLSFVGVVWCVLALWPSLVACLMHTNSRVVVYVLALATSGHHICAELCERGLVCVLDFMAKSGHQLVLQAKCFFLFGGVARSAEGKKGGPYSVASAGM